MDFRKLINLKEHVISLQLDREEESLTSSLCLAKMVLSELDQFDSDWIHPKEKETLKLLTFPRRRASYLLGRYCAKKALQQQINLVELDKIWIGQGVFHQPILFGDGIKTMQVSIAHTEDMGTALIFDQRHPMGIDIEINDHQHDSIIASQLISSEKKKLDDPLFSTFNIQPYPWIWTVKEALGKVLKTGLTVPLSVYEVKKIGHERAFIMNTFTNFPQYKALSFLWNEAIISIALPRKTEMTLIL